MVEDKSRRGVVLKFDPRPESLEYKDADCPGDIPREALYKPGDLMEEETHHRARLAAEVLREAQFKLHDLMAREAAEKLYTDYTERWIQAVETLTSEIESCFNLTRH